MDDHLPDLSEDEDPQAAALASLERKLQLVRDLVTGVAGRFKHGLYLYGSGGVGKSYTVLKCLESLGVAHKLYNSRLTAKGLFHALLGAPDAVFVIEDVERITKDPDAQGVLRSALWAQPGRERVVTWTTAAAELRFEFRGGIIVLSNRPLDGRLPELAALGTRIEVHHLTVSDAELTAQMRHLAGQGYRIGDKQALGPAECLEVTEYLLAECHRAGCPLDLRLQQKAFQTFRQWESDRSITDWHDLLASSVREAACAFRHEPDTESREQRHRQRRNIVRAIMRQTDNSDEQERLYKEQIGGSRRDFYRRKLEVQQRDFDEEDAGGAPPAA
jgi:hypothetical protein